MAGKFLTLEEAALRLGVPVEEVNRLVDRKELFPMRDGTTIKFKIDEIERVAADLAAGQSGSGSGLALDLDLPAAGSPSDSGDLVFSEPADDDSIFGDDLEGLAPGPKTPRPAAGGNPASGTFDVDDLGLDSIIAASSPGAGGGRSPDRGRATGDLDLDLPGDSGLALGSGTLELDLGEPSGTGRGDAAGDSGGLAIDLSDIGGPAPASGLGLPGSGIGGPLDSGLSLEKDALEVSGIDLDDAGGAAAVGSGVDAFGSGIGGEAFDLGGDSASPDDGESVVVSPDESGDSSFFTSAMDDASSTSFDGASGGVPGVGPGFDGLELAAGPSFSVWQVVGLICCTLLMFLGGLLVFDIVRTTQAPQGNPFSSVLLEGLASTFGW
jgi:excisionase family DNA binding protein